VVSSRILVVEDDSRPAATLERVLTAEGHQVEVVGDGMEALRRARQQPFDLVVLDVMLPRLDGVGGCRRGQPWPVALMTNVALPIAVLVLLRKAFL
jgi:DNA-binding response OmpR family regulator